MKLKRILFIEDNYSVSNSISVTNILHECTSNKYINNYKVLYLGYFKF